MPRITIKMLKERLDSLDLKMRQVDSHTSRIFSAEQRLDKLDHLLKGGIKGYEGLFFRVTQLEQLLQLNKHIKPATKEQVEKIRKLMKATKSHFYVDGKETTVDYHLGKNR